MVAEQDLYEFGAENTMLPEAGLKIGDSIFTQAKTLSALDCGCKLDTMSWRGI